MYKAGMESELTFAEIAPVEAGDSPRRAPRLSPHRPAGTFFRLPRFLAARVDRFAELLSEGLHPIEIAAALGLTQREGALIMQKIRRDLGWQAI